MPASAQLKRAATEDLIGARDRKKTSIAKSADDSLFDDPELDALLAEEIDVHSEKSEDYDKSTKFWKSEQDLDSKNQIRRKVRKTAEHKSGGITPDNSVKPSKQVNVTDEPKVGLPIKVPATVPLIAIPKNDAPYQP
jgi:hypothetical protein